MKSHEEKPSTMVKEHSDGMHDGKCGMMKKTKSVENSMEKTTKEMPTDSKNVAHDKMGKEIPASMK